MYVKTNEGSSKGIDVTEGVLQGETLSSLLFALFISNLEIFLKEKEVDGVTINELLKLTLLAFADDIVIFAETVESMTHILEALLEYSSLSKLTVNTSKMNVVIFRKCRRNPSNLKFYFGNKQIDYC